MWPIFITAAGLLFVLEGVLPFLSPQRWRQLMQTMFIQSDNALRIIGFISMVIGLVLVYIARNLY